MQESQAAASKENSVPFVGLKINQIAEACRENAVESEISVQPSSCGGRREVADEGRGLAGVGVINVQKMN